MSEKLLTIEKMRSLIHKGKARDPLVFLESVMSGQDPRGLSDVYELVVSIDRFTDGDDVSANDWEELVELVSSRYRYRTVSINESLLSAKTLSEYLYPKRKQVDLNTTLNGETQSLASNPLTEEDIDLFKERFNDEY